MGESVSSSRGEDAKANFSKLLRMINFFSTNSSQEIKDKKAEKDSQATWHK